MFFFQHSGDLTIPGQVEGKATGAHCAHYVKKLLGNQEREELWRKTQFGYWLDVESVEGHAMLLHYLMMHEIQPRQRKQGDEKFHFLFTSGTNEFRLSYGVEEFCIITGFRFGNWKKPRVGPNQEPCDFARRMFPHRRMEEIEVGEVLDIIDGEHWSSLTAGDAVRLAFLAFYTRGLMGRDLVDKVKAENLIIVDDLRNLES